MGRLLPRPKLIGWHLGDDLSCGFVVDLALGSDGCKLFVDHFDVKIVHVVHGEGSELGLVFNHQQLVLICFYFIMTYPNQVALSLDVDQIRFGVVVALELVLLVCRLL